MKRIPIIVFSAIAALLALFLVFRHLFTDSQEEIIRAKLIIPTENTIEQDTADSEPIISPDYAADRLTSFIPLQNDETLISAYGTDFDNDTFDDQIIAVKKSGKPYIYLIVGLYNPLLSTYERSAEIETAVAQVKTFTFTAMDITGERSIALVYTGINDNSESVLHVYIPEQPDRPLQLRSIAAFSSADSVYIQQVVRSEEYAMSKENGASFPIWIYSTDTSRGPDSYDQLQTMYDWDTEEKKYIKKTETRVEGQKIRAKELAKILDGSVKTFTTFLDGLWYKTSDSARERRYIFFDPAGKEIIFLAGSTQEVYTWQSSSLRRNGIQLSSVNKSITNLSRRFDINLSQADEIRVKLSDDVRMIIGEETLWDGQYKKMNINSKVEQAASSYSPADIYEYFSDQKKIWKTTDRSVSFFFSGSSWTAVSGQKKDAGVYTASIVHGKEILQFRPAGSNSVLSGFYQLERAKTKETQNIVQLSPVSVHIDSIYQTSGKKIILEYTLMQ